MHIEIGHTSFLGIWTAAVNIAIQMPSDAHGFENHLVGCEGTRFVTEDVGDLS